MGKIIWKNLNKHIHLRAVALVGRRPTCDVRIDSPQISSHHASFHWNNESWEVHDLGSRNGTFVNGRRLAAGERSPVDAGAVITLGREVAEFELVDPSPPGAVAINQQTGHCSFSEGGLLALPHDRNPLVTVYADSDGEWLVECGDAPKIATDGETLDIDGICYRLELPNSETETQQNGTGPPTLASIALRFAVTPDEEQVEVTTIIGGHPIQLPTRRFHYLLVTLARVWLAEEGMTESMRGWVDRDELCRGLNMDATKLGVDIYRARKQLAALGVQGAAGLIERRSGTYELRLGVRNVQVVVL